MTWLFYYNRHMAPRGWKGFILGILTFAGVSAGQTVTWSEQIAPIIYNNCTTCHRTGQVTPFTLLSYTDVKQHAPTVAAVTQSRYMPPWKPEPGWTAFRDTRGLNDSQIALIRQWVAAGMPQGDPSKEPPLPTFTDGWQLGTPDLVLTMPKGFAVPADGSDIYRNFVLHTGQTADRWISAIELKPSDRSAVHHSLFFTDTTGVAAQMDGQDGQPGFPGFGTIFEIEAAHDPANVLTGNLGGWVPGTTPEFLPNGIAYRLPAKADLILQTHFHPNGIAGTEQTTIGLYYTSAPARTITQIQVPAFFGIQSGIDIPAGMNNYMVRGSFTLPVDVDAFSVSAHCHYLGKGTRMTATFPDGHVQVLLSITGWDFNWQDTYIFKDVVALPRGTRIDGELVYDNSTANPVNPYSPPREVKWGENSTDEMGSLILNVLPHQQSDLNLLNLAIAAYSITPAPQVNNKPLFISSSIVDGASNRANAVSPGKIVVLYGQRLSGSQVLFDGVPAPLLYSTDGQVGAIVPYEVDGKAGTQVTVKNSSVSSDPVALQVTDTSPGIFSVDYTGSGQGAILNQDLTVNSSSNPAASGSVVVIYATGEGQTDPAGVDGKIAIGPVYPKPKLPVTVNIGGQAVEVLYAGAAPSLVAGVMQINARIPAGLAAGDTTVAVTVGTTQSQPGITVAVK